MPLSGAGPSVASLVDAALARGAGLDARSRDAAAGRLRAAAFEALLTTRGGGGGRGGGVAARVEALHAAGRPQDAEALHEASPLLSPDLLATLVALAGPAPAAPAGAPRAPRAVAALQTRLAAGWAPGPPVVGRHVTTCPRSPPPPSPPAVQLPSLAPRAAPLAESPARHPARGPPPAPRTPQLPPSIDPYAAAADDALLALAGSVPALVRLRSRGGRLAARSADAAAARLAIEAWRAAPPPGPDAAAVAGALRCAMLAVDAALAELPAAVAERRAQEGSKGRPSPTPLEVDAHSARVRSDLSSLAAALACLGDAPPAAAVAAAAAAGSGGAASPLWRLLAAAAAPAAAVDAAWAAAPTGAAWCAASLDASPPPRTPLGAAGAPLSRARHGAAALAALEAAHPPSSPLAASIAAFLEVLADYWRAVADGRRAGTGDASAAAAVALSSGRRLGAAADAAAAAAGLSHPGAELAAVAAVLSAGAVSAPGDLGAAADAGAPAAARAAAAAVGRLAASALTPPARLWAAGVDAFCLGGAGDFWAELAAHLAAAPRGAARAATARGALDAALRSCAAATGMASWATADGAITASASAATRVAPARGVALSLAPPARSRPPSPPPPRPPPAWRRDACWPRAWRKPSC